MGLHCAGPDDLGVNKLDKVMSSGWLTAIKNANKFCYVYSIVQGIKFSGYLFKSNIFHWK